MATNPALLLFFLLAGVGVALLVTRRDVGTSVLVRRALFLRVIGGGLAVTGRVVAQGERLGTSMSALSRR